MIMGSLTIPLPEREFFLKLDYRASYTPCVLASRDLVEQIPVARSEPTLVSEPNACIYHWKNFRMEIGYLYA